jgi:hypothetical protein
MSRRKAQRSLLITDDPVGESPPEAIAWPGLLAKAVPELWLACVAVAIGIAPERVSPALVEGLQLVVFAEVMFAMAQATLTDVATRLRRRPPIWLGVLIVAGIAIFYPDTIHFVRYAFDMGWAVFLPFAWSLLERVRELWTMPGASRLEKMRRRALVGGRITLVLGFGFLAVAVAGVSYFVDEVNGGFYLVERLAPWGLAAVFTLAAADIVRVHRPAFARRPRSLLPRLDPMGIEYLEPL